MFGFWGDDPPRRDYSNSFWLFMILSCFFIVIIMMNLLIAITTGIYEETMRNSEVSDYIQLCAVIYDFETLVFDVCRPDYANRALSSRHLIFTE